MRGPLASVLFELTCARSLRLCRVITASNCVSGVSRLAAPAPAPRLEPTGMSVPDSKVLPTRVERKDQDVKAATTGGPAQRACGA